MNIQNLIEEMKKEYQKREADKKSNVSLPLVYSFYESCEKLITLDFIKIDYKEEDIARIIENIKEKLSELLIESGNENVEGECERFLSLLPSIRELVFGSADSILDGDPASNSIEEIVRCYPGFSAILHYRIAHPLYLIGMKQVARIISEKAHKETGIDISPGATIGKRLFIDHGTGIVIGETAIIGDNVKLYQGVTIGAKSLSRGKFLKGNRRHPTIEDNVTIYSNASILGGNTIIGKGVTIGANVYLTASIEKGSVVYLCDSGIKIVTKQERM